MDIYRYFHPHHNPKLLRKGLREQELGELEQAAAELLRAIKRAERRVELNPMHSVTPACFADIAKALEFVRGALDGFVTLHPGDSLDDFTEMVEERSTCTGWGAWIRLVSEKVSTESKDSGSEAA